MISSNLKRISILLTCTIVCLGWAWTADARGEVPGRSVDQAARADLELLRAGDWIQGRYEQAESVLHFESFAAEAPGGEVDRIGRVWAHEGVLGEVRIYPDALFVNLSGIELTNRELSPDDIRRIQDFAVSPEAEALRSMVARLNALQLDGRRSFYALSVLAMAIGEDGGFAATVDGASTFSLEPGDGDALRPIDWCPGPEYIPNCTNPITNCLGCCGVGCAGCLDCCTSECLAHDNCCRTKFLGCADPVCLALFPAAAASVYQCLDDIVGFSNS